MLGLNRTHSQHCILLPFICSHFSQISVSLRLKRKLPEVKRVIFLASHTGNPVFSIHMLPMTSLLINRTKSLLSQLGSIQENPSKARKVVASLPPSHRNRPRVLNRVNDNYCVKCATGLKDCQLGLNPSPVMAKNRDLSSKTETVNLLVNSCVANAHSDTGLPQKKGVIPNYCHNSTEIKYVKDVSCVGRLSSVNLVTNAPTVAIDLLVESRLHQFWKKWEDLGASPKVVTVLPSPTGYSYTHPFRFRPNITRSPTGPEHLEHLTKHRVVQNGDP